MRIPGIFLAALAALPIWSQEPVVLKNSIWPDTVKRGEMTRRVRALGEITSGRNVELRVAETQVSEVRAGQEVSIDARKERLLAGKVTRVGSAAVNGVISVEVRLNAPLPQGMGTGLPVDGTIFIGKLSDVTYVGRPVFGQANSAGSLFKIDADGEHASRVQVRFGRTSVNTIEVVEGLQPGDRVILSDMSAYASQSRIRLK